LALLDVKGNFVTFVERFEPRFVDAGMMNEYIRAIFLLDKAVSPLIVEPFYNTTGHTVSPFFNDLIVSLILLDG